MSTSRNKFLISLDKNRKFQNNFLELKAQTTVGPSNHFQKRIQSPYLPSTHQSPFHNRNLLAE